MDNNKNKNKKVLVISYFFPPLSGPGVQRAFCFVKNLKKRGWEPVVLTVKDIEYVSRDEKLLEELRDITIFRSGSLDPMRGLYLWREMTGKRKGKSIYQTASARIKKLGRDFLPIDSKVGWLVFALPLAKKICRLYKIDIIYATLSPYSSGILAYITSRATGIPYILDYRDLWKGKPDISYFSNWHEKIAVAWEKKIIRDAAAIIQVTKRSAEKFLELYPDCPAEKVNEIFNGYEAEKFLVERKARKAGDKLCFTFAGNFYGGQSPAVFLEAVSEMMQSDESLSDVTFSFIGNYNAGTEQLFHKLEYVERIPSLAYNEYLKKLIDSDVLVLFISNQNSEMIIPQKLFDYLAARHPILALIPEQGEAAAIIRKYRAGIICDGDLTEKIKEGIREMLSIFRKGEEDQRFPLWDNDYREFQRNRQAEQLSEIMQAVCDG
jgi:glycosyltransferase involved in cell wall biosynthesis